MKGQELDKHRCRGTEPTRVLLAASQITGPRCSTLGQHWALKGEERPVGGLVLPEPQGGGNMEAGKIPILDSSIWEVPKFMIQRSVCEVITAILFF